MTLPAHRYLQRKKDQAAKDDSRVVVFDYDGTVTGAPEFMALVARGLKALGCHIVVLTGNTSERSVLVQALTDFGFPFDDLVQYHDDGTEGIARAQHLKQFGAFAAFDNRVDRAIVLGKVCPHAYLIVEPSKDDEHQAKKVHAKHQAKKAADKIGLRAAWLSEHGALVGWLSERRGIAHPPPGLRVADGDDGQGHEKECGTCLMYHDGLCWGYGRGDGQFPTFGEWVCDSWALDPDWETQDVVQDALDGVDDTP